MNQTEIMEQLAITGDTIKTLKQSITESIKQLKEHQQLHCVLLENMKGIRGKEFISILEDTLGQSAPEIHQDFINYRKLMKRQIINTYCLKLMGVL